MDDGDGRYETELPSERLRLCCDDITMLIGVPCKKANEHELFHESKPFSTYDTRKTVVPRNGFPVIAFPSLERLC